MQVASMTEMRRSEAKESEVNHRFVEHAQWSVVTYMTPAACIGHGAFCALIAKLCTNDASTRTHVPQSAGSYGLLMPT